MKQMIKRTICFFIGHDRKVAGHKIIATAGFKSAKIITWVCKRCGTEL